MRAVMSFFAVAKSLLNYLASRCSSEHCTMQGSASLRRQKSSRRCERICRAALAAAVLGWWPLGAMATEWRQFRGNDHQSVAAQVTLAADWGQQAPAMAWRQDLPGRGVSSPIVAHDRLVVTASSGHNQDRLHVLCFDATTGRQLWHRQFWATGRTATH